MIPFVDVTWSLLTKLYAQLSKSLTVYNAVMLGEPFHNNKRPSDMNKTLQFIVTWVK